MATARPGGASAADKGKDLRTAAAAARAQRQAGAKVVRGKSETALKKQAKAWDAGAVGEGRAQRALDRLARDKRWVVLHDRLLAPPKKWNLDHVVVGPAGAFFVDAKNWRGDVRIGKGGQLWRSWWGGPKTGRQSANMTKEVHKVHGMAQQMADTIHVTVQPVIVLAGARSRRFEGVEYTHGVMIVSVDRIYETLRDAPARWGQVDIERVARRCTKAFPPATHDTPQDAQSAAATAWKAGLSGAPVPAPAATPSPPGAGRPAHSTTSLLDRSNSLGNR